MKSKYVVIDLETTGNNPKNGDRIIQIAANVIENGEITYQYSSYINPGRSIPLFIQELTGITDADVENAPTFKELAPYIIGVLDEAVFVAHNVLFDLTFLQAELERVGYERFLGYTVDTVELAKIVNPGMSSFKLEELGKAYGFLHERPHQADSDAYVTALLFIEFYKQLKKLPKPTIKSLYRLSFLLKSELKELLAEILNEYSTMSEPWRPDLDIYRGIAIVRQKSIESLTQQENEKKHISLDESALHNILKKSFKSHNVSLVEDGTRDFTAHIKAFYEYANENHVQVTIAAHTKHTAEQLMGIFQRDYSSKMIQNQVSILHSKEQYLSLPKFEQSMREKQQNYESTIAKMQILVWLTMTNTGCLEELNLSSGGREYWKEVAHHAHLHPRLLKPWTERDFYSRQMLAAKQAKIILTTHDSLISDIQTGDFLSECPNIVLEEANYFPSSVESGLTKELSYVEVRNLLNKIGTLDNRQLLRSVILLLKEKTTGPYNENQLAVLLEEIACSVESFFEALFTYGMKSKKDMDGPRVQCKLDFSELENKKYMDQLLKEANDLYDSLGLLVVQFQQILGELNQVPIEKLKRSQFNIIDELTKLSGEINLIRVTLNRFFKSLDTNDEVWASWNVKGNRNSVQIYAQPLSVSKWVNRNLLRPDSHILFISDVLTVGGSFHFISQQLGVQENKLSSLVIPPVKEQYLTILTPLKEKSGYTLIDFVKKQQKPLILLFQSQESLKTIYNDMKGLAEFTHIQLQAQGLSSGSAMKMLRNHLAVDQSILLMNYTGWDQVWHTYNGRSMILMVEPPVEMNSTIPDEDLISELIINLRSLLNTSPNYKKDSKWVLIENDLIRSDRSMFEHGLNYVKPIYRNMEGI